MLRAAARGLISSSVLWAACFLFGCESELVTLGRLPDDGSPLTPSGGRAGFRFGLPVQRAELGTDSKEDNATLTADALWIYFTRGGDAEVFRARRSSVDEPFEAPAPFAPANTDVDAASPAISLDGRTLWVGQEREDDSEDSDIWVTRQNDDDTWTPLEIVAALNSPLKDIPRPPAGGNLVMPLGSQRGGAELDYRTYLAARPSETADFGAPVPIPELELGRRVVDGFLTEDLLTLFFSSGEEENDGDLFYVQRPTLNDPFGAPVALADLNRDDSDERDPWLSPDSTRFFFTSDRLDENHEIFEVVVSRE
jgi:hypothetical protein